MVVAMPLPPHSGRPAVAEPGDTLSAAVAAAAAPLQVLLVDRVDLITPDGVATDGDGVDRTTYETVTPDVPALVEPSAVATADVAGEIDRQHADLTVTLPAGTAVELGLKVRITDTADPSLDGLTADIVHIHPSSSEPLVRLTARTSTPREVAAWQ